MHALALAHLVLVSMWGGLLCAEAVLEIGAVDDQLQWAAARTHYWLDLLLEAPLGAAILATGVALGSAGGWPTSPLFALKIACALVAIGCNLTCLLLVVGRYTAGPGDVRRFRRPILLTGLGAPFGLGAFAIGVAAFGS